MNTLLNKEECREIQLNMLKAIDHFCSQNGWWYSLGYGSLLGAVRHKGFIPWDDDIDIIMFREDYEQFIEFVKRQHDVPWLSVIDADNTKGYYYPFAKVVHNKTLAKQNDTIVKQGLWIDVFPLDKTPIEEGKRMKFLRKNKFLRNWLLFMVMDFKNMKFSTKVLVKYMMAKIGLLVGKDRLFKYTVAYNQKYRTSKSPYVCCLSTPYIITENFLRKDIEETSEMEFEGDFFKGIKKYDLYLSQIYGNYNQLPPPEKRINHEMLVVKIE